MANYQATENEQEALKLVTKLLRAANAVSSSATGFLSDYKLTTSQFGVLEALYHLGPMCQKEVAAKTLKSTGNIVTVIDNLEKRGLVERVRSEKDRRYITLHITEAGTELIDEIMPDHNVRVAKCFSVLQPEERVEFGRLCKKLGLGQQG